MDRIQGCSLDSYAWAIEKVVGESSIIFIGRHPNDDGLILVFLRTTEIVEKLVTSGVWLRGTWLNVSYFQRPASKLIISGVMPFVPDGTIIEAFAPYGTPVFPILRKIPAAVRDRHFKGLLSYRREIYIVKSSPEINFPKTLNIMFLGISYMLEVSPTGARCFACGSLAHTIASCDHKNKRDDHTKDLTSSIEGPVPEDVTQTAILSAEPGFKKINSNVLSPLQPTAHSGNVGETSDIAGGKEMPTTKDHFTQCNLLSVSKPKFMANSGNKQVFRSDYVHFEASDDPNKLLGSKSIIQPGVLVVKSLVPALGATSHKGTVAAKPGIRPQLGNSKAVSGLASPIVVSDRTEQPVQQHNKIKKPRKSLNIPIQDVSMMFQTSDLVQGQKSSGDGAEEMVVDQAQCEEARSQSVSSSPSSLSESPNKKKNKIKKHTVKRILMANNDTMHDDIGSDQANHTNNLTCVQSNMEAAVILIEDWLEKSVSLKIGPKKKLANQMLQQHPNLEDIISVALSVSDKFPTSSARTKKS